jgi:hypothetical protein
VPARLPVEHAVVDRLGDVVGIDPVAGFEVGDRAGDAEDLVVGAGGETEHRAILWFAALRP